jgi:hypothetical protein
MAETAFQTAYRQEFIAGFELRQSLLRSAATTEAVIKGNSAVFLVADSNGAAAVTRGVNGLIPARADSQTQNTCTLYEQHDLVRKTGFNVFGSQGDQRRMMQQTSMGVLNRKIDSDILSALGDGTNDTGSAATASLALVMKARAILGNAEVPTEEEDNMFAIMSPAFEAYMMQVSAFTSADFVEVKPFTGPARRFRRWAGCNWIVHPNVSGVGTNAEKCFMFHRNAIGHAINMGDLQSIVGYDEEQDYSYARTTGYMGAKLLQNSGVVVMNHDGSAYVAA